MPGRRCGCVSRRCSTTSASRFPARARITPSPARSSPRRRCGGSATRTSCASASCGSCASTRSRSATGDALEARRMLARYGDGLTFDLLDHWEADLRGRDQTDAVREKLDRVARFRASSSRSSTSPHRLSDLAVDGDRPDRARLPAGPRARAHARGAARRGRRRAGPQPPRDCCSRAPRSCCARDPLGGARPVRRRVHDA